MTQGWFRVLENRELSHQNYRLIFDSKEIARAAQPGQFLQIGATGCLLKRPFSVCDVAGSRVTILYKIVGKGTTAMAALQKGDKLDVVGPLGRPFSAMPDWFHRVFVGGGVGVPPLYFLAKRERGKSKMDKVFIGARKKSDLLYVSEFKKLGLGVQTATEDGSAGKKGYVTGPFQQYLNTLTDMEKAHAVVFTCGPKAMMKAVSEVCAKHAITCIASLEEIMGCGVGVCMGCVMKVKRGDDFFYERVCTEGPVMETDKILWE